MKHAHVFRAMRGEVNESPFLWPNEKMFQQIVLSDWKKWSVGPQGALA